MSSGRIPWSRLAKTKVTSLVLPDQFTVTTTTGRRVYQVKEVLFELEVNGERKPWPEEAKAAFLRDLHISLGSEASKQIPYLLGEDCAEPDTYRASFFLDYLVSTAHAEDMQANLAELYPLWVERHGCRKAERIRRFQIGLLIAGHWWGVVVGAAERILKAVRLVGS